jgi:hypothetical protein
MALLFVDGFDHYATADILKKWDALVNGSINASGGRRSGGCLTLGVGSYGVKKNLPGSYSTLIVGFALSPTGTDSSNNVICVLYESSTIHIKLRYNTSNKIEVYRGSTLLGTTANTVPISSFTYLEIKAVIHDTTGSIVIKLNGVTDLTLTSIDTRNGGTAGVIDQVHLGDPLTFCQNCKIDDFYIADTSGSAPNNDFLGDVRIDTIYPTSDGNYLQFTPSTGSTHFDLVDETAPNTTDYNSSSTVNNRDSYGMDNLAALSSQTVYGVQVNAAVLKDDAGVRSLSTMVRSSITNGDGASVSLGTSQRYISQLYELNPNGSVVWTETTVNAMEAGVKVTA